MLEYLPWSKMVQSSSLTSYTNGIFSVLDVELGGECNYRCLYCDSPQRDKRCSVELGQIEALLKTGTIKWVFICGLGEPTAGSNMQLLLQILDLCKQNGAKCSMFTNLSILNNDLLYYVEKKTLHLLFKYDSKEILDCLSLYDAVGVTRQLLNIKRLKNFVSVEHGCTNIGASIVPTQINKKKIANVVRDCYESGIYPLIAELERSGEALKYYDQLYMDSNELIELKEEIEKIIGEPYTLPVCPAVICGIHVRHDGSVTVDESTGLSCHWFWLKEPKTKTIGNFNRDDISVIANSILQYRKTRLESIKDLLDETDENIFGGCGGVIPTLMREYLYISEKGALN